MVKKIREGGITVISEIELAYRHKGDSKMIGITGSNGKTTTLRSPGISVRRQDWIVPWWEISGFHLPGRWRLIRKPCMWWRSAVFSWMISKTFRPDIAVVIEYHGRIIWIATITGLKIISDPNSILSKTRQQMIISFTVPMTK